MWFIGIEVEQGVSAPPPKENPGSAPVKPFMQTNVRIASDTLSGASQWAEQTTLFLVNHSLGEPYIHEKKNARASDITQSSNRKKTRSSYRNGI